MKYDITEVKKMTNGGKWCRYYAIYNTETKEIIYETHWNVSKANLYQPKIEAIRNKLNNGELETEIITTTSGHQREVVK